MFGHASVLTRLFGRRAFGTLPFCLGKPFTDGRLFFCFLTAAVIDDSVDHAVIVLHAHFRVFQGIVFLSLRFAENGESTRTVAHNQIFAVVGFMVNAVTCRLHLLFGQVGQRKTAARRLHPFACQMVVRLFETLIEPFLLLQMMYIF